MVPRRSLLPFDLFDTTPDKAPCKTFKDHNIKYPNIPPKSNINSIPVATVYFPSAFPSEDLQPPPLTSFASPTDARRTRAPPRRWQGGPYGRGCCRKALVLCPASLVKNWAGDAGRRECFFFFFGDGDGMFGAEGVVNTYKKQIKKLIQRPATLQADSSAAFEIGSEGPFFGLHDTARCRQTTMDI